ncbi:hypothetical protein ABTW24_05470 [Sphingobacterium thalpophilum]|uniref:Uncharacterized protein n=1 Tax=Sphingobacterium thalpophilum TaxID=259 RepID=A0ABV4HAH4_9SPHI
MGVIIRHLLDLSLVIMVLISIWHVVFLYFSLAPSILFYREHGKFRYQKQFGKNSLRKFIINAIVFFILFYFATVFRPAYLNDSSSHFNEIVLFIFCVVSMFLLFLVNKKLIPSSPVPYIRDFFRKGSRFEDLFEEESEDSVSNSIFPLFKHVVRKEVNQTGLKLLFKGFTSLSIDENSTKRLAYLLKNGELFEEDKKVQVRVQNIKEGQIDQNQLISFLNQIFSLESFYTENNPTYRLGTFIKDLNSFFEVLTEENKPSPFYHQAFSRWMKNNLSVIPRHATKEK